MKPITQVLKRLNAQKHFANGVKLSEYNPEDTLPILIQNPAEAFLKAIENDPHHTEAWKRILATGPTQDQLIKLARISASVLQDNPHDIVSLGFQAQVYEMLGHEGKALEHYNTILKLDPRVDQAWSAKGRLLKKVSRLKNIVDLNHTLDQESLLMPRHESPALRQAIWAYRQGFDEIAVSRLQPLVKEGDAHAQMLLGRMYLQGRGVEKNLTLGVSLCKKAAVAGDAMAEWLVSIWYQQGLVLEKNEEEGFKWLKRAAEHAFPRAQIELAECLEWGYLTPRNLTDALYWYEQAASLHDWRAYERIAEFFSRYGQDSIREEKVHYWTRQLVEWHESLAMKGSGESIIYLLKYYIGEGPLADITPPDYQRARLWARIGAKKGLSVATDYFRRMAMVESTSEQ